MTFLSEEELAPHLNDGRYVAEKANEYIRGIEAELERVKAAVEASSITTEQTCSILEQKYLALSTEYGEIESANSQLQSLLDKRTAELAEIQSQKHQLHLLSIEKDGEIERLITELSEVKKSKRQLIELLGHKDSEISEKNVSLSSYLDKIVKLTDSGAQKQNRVNELEVELARSESAWSRLNQEKELLERHTTWLSDELNAKVDKLHEIRSSNNQTQEELSNKLSDVGRKLDECTKSLKRKEDKIKDLEDRNYSLQEELSSCKESAAFTEDRLIAELSTVNKLVELYKENSEEWSKKAGEYEGVIKALEIRLSQVESDYKEKLEKEVSNGKNLETEVVDLKRNLERLEAELENRRKINEQNLLPTFSTEERWIDEFEDKNYEEGAVVPKIPVGVSGTTLAASLLRNGWSLAKMYSKYQEAVDAFRHEQLGRKESEAVLQRVLCELEEKAGIILDERAEYERMAESHAAINNSLQRCIDEKEDLEKAVLELKVELRRADRDNNLSRKEIIDLQNQVTVLLKECRDLQRNCGKIDEDDYDENSIVTTETGTNVESDAQSVISQQLMTFRDINGLVEQNVQLRSLARNLSEQIESKEREFEEKLQLEVNKVTEEAETKVTAVLRRAEEQGQMIESLHTSVAMYKRLYEEEHRVRYTLPQSSAPIADSERKDLLLFLEGSKEAGKKAQEKAAENIRILEEDLAKARSDIILIRAERDRSDLEAKFSREKLDSFMKEYEQQRTELNAISLRNIELSHLIVDHQKKLRESSESLNSAEEISRKHKMEISILKHEKEMLSNAEKRACDEVRSLSERVYRLQASLDTIQSAEEIREEARIAERKKQEEYIQHLEREWAAAKKDIQQERDNVRALTSDKEQSLKNTGKQYEDICKELTKALNVAMSAESRAAVAEAKVLDMEKKSKPSNVKVAAAGDATAFSTTEVVTDLIMAKEEIEKLNQEVKANKEHMLQYKSIAEVNEGALKQMESAHETYKTESEKMKESLETQLRSLKERVSELESELVVRSNEVANATTGKEEALSSALAQLANLKEEVSNKSSKVMLLESEITSLREDLEKAHDRYSSAQRNYERQVILQSETIQELTRTSESLALLQRAESESRMLVDVLRSENNDLKAKWDEEKTVIEDTKKEMEKKYEELNEQNKILLDRLEAQHIQIAEKNRMASTVSSENNSEHSQDNDPLQNVVNYLRRSREIGELEISRFKQENLRLRSQLETALSAAERSQSLLQAERERSRAVILSEDEIKSLQLQVREIDLLRESNIQLREENKRNFEESQKFREVAQHAQTESLNLETLLREKEIELEAYKKKIDLEIIKKEDLERKISESRIINAEEHDKLKYELRMLEEKMKEKDDKMRDMHDTELKLQEAISRLEQDSTKNKVEMNQKEKQIQDTLQNEIRLRSELEKQKRLFMNWKRKSESLSKEKLELNEEKSALVKQIEDLKQARRPVVSTGEQVKEKEEKEHRIQILERTVERLRDELKRKEERLPSVNRPPNLDTFKDLIQMRSKIEQQKHTLEGLLSHQADVTIPEDIPRFCIGVLEDIISYLSSVESFANSLSGGANLPDSASDPPAGGNLSSAKFNEDREGNVAGSKSAVETRKLGRKLVRPKLGKPEDVPTDIDMSEPDSSVGKKTATSGDSDILPSVVHVSSSPARKRLATDETVQVSKEGESSEGIHAVKKSKISDGGTETVEDPSMEIKGNAADEAGDVASDPIEGSNEDEKEEGEYVENVVVDAETKPLEVSPPVETPVAAEVEVEEGESEKEEGEMGSDSLEVEDGAVAELTEELPDFAVSPARVEDELIKDENLKIDDAVEPPEDSPTPPSKGENDEAAAAGGGAQSEVDQPRNSAAISDVEAPSRQGEMEENKQGSQSGSSSTVVNLAERAKERAMLRQYGSGSVPPPATTARGRAIRARIARAAARGTRGGRGPPPGQQGF